MKKFLILKEHTDRKWEIGDILLADDRSANQLLNNGFVEPYLGDKPNKHTIIMVDPVKLKIINKK